MKVAHFHFGKEGGAERFFVHLVNALHERGVEQKAVIRPNRSWQKDIETAADLKFSNFRTLSADKLLLPLHIKKLSVNWQPNAYLAWMSRACRLMPKKASCLRIARLGDYPQSLSPFANVDVLVCNTPNIVKHIKDMGWARKAEMISNFTFAQPASPINRAMLGTPEDAFVISAMGRFVERKGFDVLIRSMAYTKDMYLWIIGTGREENNLKELAKKSGIEERVRFLGWQSNPNTIVAASNVFASASNHEPLGNIILEAWAQGVPVISTKSEGPSWFMKDYENGLLVDIGDAEGFAKSYQLIREEKQLASTLVAGANQTLKSRFSKKAVTDKYLELFSQKP